MELSLNLHQITNKLDKAQLLLIQQLPITDTQELHLVQATLIPTKVLIAKLLLELVILYSQLKALMVPINQAT